jgi:Tol biopolymer transport system component
MPGVAIAGWQRPRSFVLALTAALSACTLTSDSFDPVPVSQEDAGPPALDESSAPLNEDEEVAADQGCTEDGALGIRFNGDDPSCPSSVGLLPAQGSSEADAGALAEPAEPVSLPSCEGELGAFEPPEPITGLDFSENAFGPALSTDGRTLYFSAYVSGEQQIYAATRDERGRAFEDVRELASVSSPASDGSPFISADDERLYLFSERGGGLGGRDVWISRRQSPAAPFEPPQLLAGVNSSDTELLPWLSAEELTLIFVSNRPGGRGGSDLWMARRDSIADDFEAPTHLADLSSEENEGRAVLSRDGLSAFFSSDRSGGRGGHDLWMAIRAQRQQPFVVLLNLAALNSSENDQDVALSSDGTELFFASSRGGVSQLWRAARRCEPSDAAGGG